MKINKMLTIVSAIVIAGCNNPVQTVNTDSMIQKETFRASQNELNTETGSKETLKTISIKAPVNIFKKDKIQKVLFDTGSKPLGLEKNEAEKAFFSLNGLLENNSYEVIFSDISAYSALSDFDTIAVMSPSKEFKLADIEKLNIFVSEGGKLIVSGEWGGFSGFNPDSFNMLLKKANLKINQDLIKETEKKNYLAEKQDIIVSNLTKHPIMQNTGKLVLFGSATIEQLENRSDTQIIAFSSSSGFRIKNGQKSSGLIGMSSLGKGKVIVTGDTSLFTESKFNLASAEGNQQFALNIFGW